MEIQERIKSKTASASVIEARSLNGRIRFHSSPKGDISEEARHMSFLDTLGISEEKKASYKACLVAPYCTNSITAEGFKRASRVFKSNDFKAIGESIGIEPSEYIKKYSLTDYFESIVLNVLKTDPFSYIFIDKSKDGGLPYQYIVSIDSVLSVSEKYRDGKIYVDEILFQLSEEEFVFANRDVWAVYNKDGVLTDEANHYLGVCPCVNVWHDFIDYENLSCKEHITSQILSELDKFMILKYGRFISSLTDFFPIFWRYEDDKSTNNALKSRVGQNTKQSAGFGEYCEDGRELEKKPLRLLGNVITVPKPKLNNADMRQPMGRIESDTNLMEQTASELDKWEQRLINSIVSGNLSSSISSELSGNPTATQIRAVINDRTEFLNKVKGNVQKSYNLLLNTLISLEKSSEYKEYISVDLGNDFFLLEESEAITIFEAAKKAGFGNDEMIEIYRHYLKARYAKDPKRLKRALVVSYLEPLPYYSVIECKKESLLSEEDFKNKVSISEIISKFESDNSFNIGDLKESAYEISKLIKNKDE